MKKKLKLLQYRISISSAALIMLAISGALFCSCDDMETKDKRFNFIGDSLIARWPLDEDFPSLMVYNYGLSGAVVGYLAEYEGRFMGQDVVVMIGTNDYRRFYSDNIDEYIALYLNTISRLSDRNIYLYSVLPRDYEGDPEDVNAKISSFNEKVKASLTAFPNIRYLDVYDDFLYKDHLNYQLYSDGLHLTTYGYQVLSYKLNSAL